MQNYDTGTCRGNYADSNKKYNKNSLASKL